jgi:hypothetical protein
MKSLAASGDGCSAASARTQSRQRVEQKWLAVGQRPFALDTEIASEASSPSSARQNEQHNWFERRLLAAGAGERKASSAWDMSGLSRK